MTKLRFSLGKNKNIIKYIVYHHAKRRKNIIFAGDFSRVYIKYEKNIYHLNKNHNYGMFNE